MFVHRANTRLSPSTRPASAWPAFAVIFFTCCTMAASQRYLGTLQLHYVVLLATLTAFILGNKSALLRYAPRDFMAIVFCAFWGCSIISLFTQQSLLGTVTDRFGRDAFSLSLYHALMPLLFFSFGVVLRFERHVNSIIPLLCLIIFASIVTAGRLSFVDYQAILLPSGISATHFIFSDATVLLTMAIVAMTKGWQSAFAAVLGIGLLALIQGRTALYLATAAITVASLLRGESALRLALVAATAVAAAMTYLTLNPDALAHVLLSSGSTDTSVRLRADVLRDALPHLRDLVLLGDYRWAVLRYENWGYYVHNGLSYWTQYGLVVFLASSLTIILLLRRAYDTARDPLRRKMPFEQFRFMLAIYTVASVILAKSFVWPWIWFATGLYVTWLPAALRAKHASKS